MPLKKYYAGHGKEVMTRMKTEYGKEKGERVFYATANKMKNDTRRSVMGRKVIHHSPDKHPEQSDAMTAEQMDRMLEQQVKGMKGTYEDARKQMKPFQLPALRDVKPIKTKTKGY